MQQIHTRCETRWLPKETRILDDEWLKSTGGGGVKSANQWNSFHPQPCWSCCRPPEQAAGWLGHPDRRPFHSHTDGANKALIIFHTASPAWTVARAQSQHLHPPIVPPIRRRGGVIGLRGEDGDNKGQLMMLSGKKARKPRLLATVSLQSTLSLSRWLRPPVCLRVSVLGVGECLRWGLQQPER